MWKITLDHTFPKHSVRQLRKCNKINSFYSLSKIIKHISLILIFIDLDCANKHVNVNRSQEPLNNYKCSVAFISQPSNSKTDSRYITEKYRFLPSDPTYKPYHKKMTMCLGLL